MATVEILDEGKMTAEQLKRNVDAGDIVSARVGLARYVNIKRTTHPATGTEVYALYGSRTGTHSLAVKATDAERLLAHWRGYTEQAAYWNGVRDGRQIAEIK
jgi:hypothetical protein